MLTTSDIKQKLAQKYKDGKFRITKSGVKTVELQNVQFVADKDFILREPNYDYVEREIAWYKSQSLNVHDIPGGTPAIWESCADVNGDINSNYGWMIWSKENGSQYNNCIWHLINDITTRNAVMIYTRPSMHVDATSNHKHDFCCTHYVHCFLNEHEDGYKLKYIVDLTPFWPKYNYTNTPSKIITIKKSDNYGNDAVSYIDYVKGTALTINSYTGEENEIKTNNITPDTLVADEMTINKYGRD